MTAELQTTLEIIGAGILLRLWSMYEHRKSGRQVNEIHSILNGELEKKLEQAREEGRQEILNQK